MSHVVLDRVVKRYGPVNAVDGVSLSVARGEFVGLLGPSGMRGKTTTLQMIAGFTIPDGGAITLGGRDLTRIPANRRNVGIVFQSYALFPHLTVARQHRVSGWKCGKCRGRNGTRGSARRSAKWRWTAWRTATRVNCPVDSSSALRWPAPWSLTQTCCCWTNLWGRWTAKLREGMQIELRQLQRKLGITTILVTHDQAEAMALCDRVAVMDRGRILQVAEPWEAYERPADAFVSGFLGKTNRLEGRAEAGAVVFGGGRLLLPRPVPDGPVTLWIRPERLRFCDESGVPGRIANRVFLGQQWLYEVDSAAGRLLMVTQNDGGAERAIGAPVQITAAPAGIRMDLA